MKTSPRVELICIGTELLTGKVNTHTAYLGRQLGTLGLSIAREHTVGDDKRVMEEVFREAWRRADIVLSAGGLGPTYDDITREAWSRVTGRPLRMQNDIVRAIENKFRSRGIKMPPMNRRQGMVLNGATVIVNPVGTAPGQFLAVGKKILVLLPGPASELYPMVERTLLAKLRARFSTSVYADHVFYLVGVAESQVDHIIRPLVTRTLSMNGCKIVHGILASQAIISVKFRVEGRDMDTVSRVKDKVAAMFHKKLSSYIYGQGTDTLESVVGDLLLKQNKKLAVAESCTGGLISKLLTDRAGASEYFLEGAITYSNKSKIQRLGVKQHTLARFGAVSAQTAKEMARGVRVATGADVGLSVTGVAGPAGGSSDKPVGLVYVGCSRGQKTTVKEFRFKGDRATIRHRAALMALDYLRRELLS